MSEMPSTIRLVRGWGDESPRPPPHNRDRHRSLSISLTIGGTVTARMNIGTGFYKVPSLRGVWFRNGHGHGGQIRWTNGSTQPDERRLRSKGIPHWAGAHQRT
jgi:hypothetical protein